MGNVLYFYIQSLSIVIIDLHSMDFWMPRCLLLFKPLLNVPVILIRHNSCFFEVSLIYNCLNDWHLTSKNQGFRVTKDKTMNTINTLAFVSQVLVENMFCIFFFQSTFSSKSYILQERIFLTIPYVEFLGTSQNHFFRLDFVHEHGIWVLFSLFLFLSHCVTLYLPQHSI